MFGYTFTILWSSLLLIGLWRVSSVVASLTNTTKNARSYFPAAVSRLKLPIKCILTDALNSTMFNKIIKSSLVLVSGVALGQVFLLAVAPSLTRLYSPSEFGVFSIYTAVLYLIVSFSTLRYDASIPLMESDDDAIRMTLVCICIVMLTSLMSFIFILIFRSTIPIVNETIFQWAVPIGVLLAGSYNVLQNYRLRTGDHLLIAKIGVLQAIGGG